jgi:SAM-dependent methyltransferase
VSMSPPSKSEQTIQDFGEQWTKFPDSSGYFGSVALFDDIFAPLLNHATLAGKRVADIGAGNGRFVNVCLDAGATEVVAVEPSAAFDVLKARTSERADRVTYLKVTGDLIPADLDLDYVFSIGVLHHIPEPGPVVVAARRSLRRGGMCCAWLYGKEGNGAYLALVTVLRAIGRPMPHAWLAALAWLLYWPLRAYIELARHVNVPLGKYMIEVLDRLEPDKVRVVIYDQLNPAYAKYYRREEVHRLFAQAGYSDIRLHHRHGYSWTVCATRPADDPE